MTMLFKRFLNGVAWFALALDVIWVIILQFHQVSRCAKPERFDGNVKQLREPYYARPSLVIAAVLEHHIWTLDVVHPPAREVRHPRRNDGNAV
jgi:hypothetical protein